MHNSTAGAWSILFRNPYVFDVSLFFLLAGGCLLGLSVAEPSEVGCTRDFGKWRRPYAFWLDVVIVGR